MSCPENPQYGPVPTATWICEHCGGVVIEMTAAPGCRVCTKCNWKTAPPPQGGARFFDAHIARAADQERTEKVVDYTLSRIIDTLVAERQSRVSMIHEMMFNTFTGVILVLEATKERHYLANRQRLLALVEQAMGQEAGK